VTHDPQEYERRWLHTNQSVEVVTPEGDIVGQNGKQRSAVIKGLSPSGGFQTSPCRAVCDTARRAGFILADMHGHSVELHPDTTSMDMTQRLLYAKRL
jgi:hypothetical protein